MFIDSFRFMQTSLSKLVNNLSEIYSKEFRTCRERKKLNQCVVLLDLKIINYIINAACVEKDGLHP